MYACDGAPALFGVFTEKFAGHRHPGCLAPMHVNADESIQAAQRPPLHRTLFAAGGDGVVSAVVLILHATDATHLDA